MNNNSLIVKTLESIKEGNFIRRVKGYFTYDNTIVRMQTDFNNLPLLKDISPFYVREIDRNREEDIVDWIEIINDGYDDENYDINDAKIHFEKHLFLAVSNTYFIMDGKEPIATISIGRYRNDESVGGDCRIAVKKDYQGYGLGKYLVLYGFHKLREQGIIMGETMIKAKRDTSIFIHFKCGFWPQTNLDRCQFKDHTFILNRMVANYKMKRMYETYKKESINTDNIIDSRNNMKL